MCPGYVDTPMLQSFFQENGNIDSLQQAVRDVHPLRTYGTPTDIANACVYLLSDLAGYVTGQTLDVDGGPSRGALDEHDLPVFVTNPAIRARFES